MKPKEMKGVFIGSLDFELMWGVRDKKDIEQYGSNILSVHTTLKDTVKMFNDYNVKSPLLRSVFYLPKIKRFLNNIYQRL
jgi:hypothetical protein